MIIYIIKPIFGQLKILLLGSTHYFFDCFAELPSIGLRMTTNGR